jgi:hypothetical protein
MDCNLKEIKDQVYNKCALKISNFKLEHESKTYDACQFRLNEANVVCRSSKVTPKKVGQFVTFWKRIENGPIAPFNENDTVDFFIVNVRTENRLGQFVFPKSILVKKGILSTPKNEGKRAFRVYSSWDVVNSKQAEKSQKWQRDYFYEINGQMNYKRIVELYSLSI